MKNKQDIDNKQDLLDLSEFLENKYMYRIPIILPSISNQGFNIFVM